MESENQDHETCGGIGTFVGLGPLSSFMEPYPEKNYAKKTITWDSPHTISGPASPVQRNTCRILFPWNLLHRFINLPWKHKVRLSPILSVNRH